jgi:hypothetical protein
LQVLAWHFLCVCLCLCDTPIQFSGATIFFRLKNEFTTVFDPFFHGKRTCSNFVPVSMSSVIILGDTLCCLSHWHLCWNRSGTFWHRQNRPKNSNLAVYGLFMFFCMLSFILSLLCSSSECSSVSASMSVNGIIWYFTGHLPQTPQPRCIGSLHVFLRGSNQGLP